MAELTKIDEDASDLPLLLAETVERVLDEQARLLVRLHIAKDELAIQARKTYVWKVAFDQLAEAAETMPDLAQRVEVLRAKTEIDLIGAEVLESHAIPAYAPSYSDPFERPLGG